MSIPPDVDPGHLRTCLSRFVTGVVVLSYRADGATRALTVNSFTAVSLEPPLVLVSVARTARAARYLVDEPFTVSVLGAGQLEVALLFAGRNREPSQVGWESTGDDLAPAVTGALATFRCRPWQSFEGGDHRLHVGRVVAAAVRDDGDPLVFDRGRLGGQGLPYPAASAPPSASSAWRRLPRRRSASGRAR